MDELFKFVEFRNYELGITGILIHSGGNFFQILEGGKEVVKSLFVKISQDDRHYDLVKIIDESGHSPLFQEYSFDFLTVDSDRQKEFLAQIFNDEFEFLARYQSIAYLTKQFVKGSSI